MSIPKLVPMDHIKKLEDDENNAFNKMIVAYDDQKRQSDDQKEQWLAIYGKCLSPSVACKQTGISLETYKRWRSKDPSFCRGINTCIESARDELLGSALNRAIGYTRPDPDNPTEPETDFDGRVIRHGASDTLAKRLLEMDVDDGKGNRGNVVVNIDFAGIRGQVEVEAIEHEDDDPPPLAG